MVSLAFSMGKPSIDPDVSSTKTNSFGVTSCAGAWLGGVWGWRSLFVLGAGVAVVALVAQAATLPTVTPAAYLYHVTKFRLG